MADEVKLPTEEEIAQLPRWARVAFAARCARRVLPLFQKYWPTAPEEHVRAVRSAVEFAESAAARGDDAVTVDSILAAEAADAAGTTARAANAARAAAYAADTSADDPHYVVASATRAAAASGEIRPIRKDFQRILSLSRRNQWMDDRPVPPNVFGLIEDGSKDRQEENSAKALILEILCESDTDPKGIGDAVVKLWEAANEYHMARGGGVLTFDEFKQMIPALVPVGPEARG